MGLSFSPATLTATSPPVLREHLSLALRSLLPSARLKLTTTALMSRAHKVNLKLWLIDGDGMDVPLTEQESSDIFSSPPYWSFCWGSGLALAEYILLNPRWVKGRTVIDYGCGSGVVAIAAALAGAKRVIACDIDSHALAATALNAWENDVKLELIAQWCHFNESVDLLLAADVLYDPENLTILEAACQQARATIIADSRIKQFSLKKFDLIDEVRSVTVPDLGENEDVKQVRFYAAGGDLP